MTPRVPNADFGEHENVGTGTEQVRGRLKGREMEEAALI